VSDLKAGYQSFLQNGHGDDIVSGATL